MFDAVRANESVWLYGRKYLPADLVEPGAYPPSAVPNVLRGVDLVALVRDVIARKPLTLAGVRYVPESHADDEPQAVLDSTQQGGTVLVNLNLPGRLVTISGQPYEPDNTPPGDIVTEEPSVGTILQDSDNAVWRRRYQDKGWYCYDTIEQAREDVLDKNYGFAWAAMQQWAPFRFVE